MDLEKQLHDARAKLKRLEEDRTAQLQKYNDEIKQRANEQPERLQAFKDWVASYELETGRQIEGLAVEIAGLEEQVNSEDYQLHKQGLAELAIMREAALISWIRSGGTEDGFNAAWPGLQSDILKRKVLASLEGQA